MKTLLRKKLENWMLISEKTRRNWKISKNGCFSSQLMIGENRSLSTPLLHTFNKQWVSLMTQILEIPYDEVKEVNP
jgi:hypothetical protein